MRLPYQWREPEREAFMRKWREMVHDGDNGQQAITCMRQTVEPTWREKRDQRLREPKPAGFFAELLGRL